jgi:hypothetical protein
MAAEAAGLGKNQTALLKIADEPTREAQIAKVQELAEAKQKRSRFLSKGEKKQLKALEGAFDKSPMFKEAWTGASEKVRRKFTNNIMKGSAASSGNTASAEEDNDEEDWED